MCVGMEISVLVDLFGNLGLFNCVVEVSELCTRS